MFKAISPEYTVKVQEDAANNYDWVRYTMKNT